MSDAPEPLVIVFSNAAGDVIIPFNSIGAITPHPTNCSYIYTRHDGIWVDQTTQEITDKLESAGIKVVRTNKDTIKPL